MLLPGAEKSRMGLGRCLLLRPALRAVTIAALVLGLGSVPSRAFAQDGTDGTPVAGDVEEPVVAEETPTTEPELVEPNSVEPAGELTPDPPIEGSLTSNYSDVDTSNDTATVDFSGDIPSGGIDFEDIAVLSANIDYDSDDSCLGGSPSFLLDTASGIVFVLIGPAPTFTGCVDGDTGNLLTDGQARFSLGLLGGAAFATYAEAATFLDGIKITGIYFGVGNGFLFGDLEQSLTLVSASVDVDGINEVGNLTVTKTEDDPKGETVPGACFTLFAVDEEAEDDRGEEVAPEACDDDLDGDVEFEGVPALFPLVLAETTPPRGYAPGPDLPLTLDEGENEVIFPNSLGFGDLQILKYACEVDADPVTFAIADPGEPAATVPDSSCHPAAADFEIWPFDEEEDAIAAAVDASGSLIVTDLPVTNGEPHTLVETGTESSADFEIEDGETTIVQVFNNTPPPTPTAPATATPTEVPTQVPTEAPSDETPTETPEATVTSLPSTGSGESGASGEVLPVAILLLIAGLGGAAWAIRRRAAA